MFSLLKRKPDFVIGSAEDPCVLRWYIIPKNHWFNIYLHNFRRSDDDRALHDHPWWNLSIILRGGYWEHLPIDSANLKTRRWWRRSFKPYFRRAMAAHRIELDLPITGPVWSLFLPGQKSEVGVFGVRKAGDTGKNLFPFVMEATLSAGGVTDGISQ